MNDWIEELKAIDSLEKHKSNLQTVLDAYLMSEFADSKNQRTEVIVLFKHLQKLE